VIAQQVSDWARKYECSNELIDGLVKDIEAKKDLHKWADLDPFEFLPMPSSHRSSRALRLIETLTIIRNVLVFAPVALTWAAVGEASKGFEKYVANNDAAVVNFLQFWQNGYDVLPSFWRLADVARLDFLIIGVVIVLTLVSSYRNQKLSVSENDEIMAIENDRQLIAAKLALFLVEKKKISNVTFNQSLAGSVQKLQNAAAALEKTAKEMAKASTRLPKVN
jgi:hypothetical protein